MGMIYHKKRLWAKLKEKEEKREEEHLPLSDSEIELEERPGEQKYTKSDIQRMSTTDLQNLAASMGVEGAFDMTGADLKKRLISDLNL